MKVALLPSTQWGNPVLGGGTEAEYAQDISRRLKPLLEKAGHDCMIFAGQLDANGDGARASVLWGPRYALSIHSDAGYYPSSHHASLGCYQEERSMPYGSSVMGTFCTSIKHANRGMQKRTPGVNGVAVLRIPEAAGVQAFLIEVTWHDRNPDAALLRDPTWRQKADEALASSIVAYLGGNPPKPPTVTKQEDEMYCPVFEVASKRGYSVYSIPDVFNSLPYYSAVFPWLVVHNPGEKDSKVLVFITRDDGVMLDKKGEEGATFGWIVKGRTRWVVDLSPFIGRDRYTGGASLEVWSKEPIGVTAPCFAKWK